MQKKLTSWRIIQSSQAQMRKRIVKMRLHRWETRHGRTSGRRCPCLRCCRGRAYRNHGEISCGGSRRIRTVSIRESVQLTTAGIDRHKPTHARTCQICKMEVRNQWYMHSGSKRNYMYH